MAINLKSLSKPTGQRPIIATLFGEGGMGKTTLAAMFPKPVFVRTEDGTASLQGNDEVSLFPIANSSEIVAADPKAKTINQAGGGYGAGYSTAAEKHRQMREWAGALAYDNGMNVVFIGHADTETLDLPDMDPFARYTVRMHKKAIPHYTDNVDLVGHLPEAMAIRNVPFQLGNVRSCASHRHQA